MMRQLFLFLGLAITAIVFSACNYDFSSCKLGENKCNGQRLLACSLDGDWVDALDCEGLGQFCDDKKGCLECLNNNDCKDTKKTKCNAKMKVCQSTTAVCVEGEIKCDGNALNTCNVKENDFDKIICSGSKPYCDEAKGCVECRSSDDCSGAMPVCNGNTKACQDADAVCGVGETTCVGNIFHSCNATLTGFDQTVCSGGSLFCHDTKGCVECRDSSDCKDASKPVCNRESNSCQSSRSLCLEGETACKMNDGHTDSLFTCTNGDWDKGVKCRFSCDTLGIACAVCVENERIKCSDEHTFQACNATRTAFEDVICMGDTPYCHTPSDTGCVECTANTHCETKDKIKPFCNITTKVCEKIVTVCKKGETDCKLIDDKQYFMTCNATQTGFIEQECSGIKGVCDSDRGCIECTSVGECHDSSKPICNTVTNACEENACVAGQTMCQQDDKIYTCSEGIWPVLATDSCDKGCNALNTGCAACKKDEKKCDGSTLLTCNAKRMDFDVTYTCSENTPFCDPRKGCVECISGTQKCVGHKISTCSDSNIWGAAVNCQSQYTCDNDKCIVI